MDGTAGARECSVEALTRPVAMDCIHKNRLKQALDGLYSDDFAMSYPSHRLRYKREGVKAMIKGLMLSQNLLLPWRNLMGVMHILGVK